MFLIFSVLGDYLTNGRLLTPEEGCGYAKVSTPRIVGGSEAKLGKFIHEIYLTHGRLSQMNSLGIEMKVHIRGSLFWDTGMEWM